MFIYFFYLLIDLFIYFSTQVILYILNRSLPSYLSNLPPSSRRLSSPATDGATLPPFFKLGNSVNHAMRVTIGQDFHKLSDNLRCLIFFHGASHQKGLHQISALRGSSMVQLASNPHQFCLRFFCKDPVPISSFSQ